MADDIPYGSKNKIPYSSIDWVDRDTFGMKTLGGESFYFCNKSFVGTIIVLAYEHVSSPGNSTRLQLEDAW